MTLILLCVLGVLGCFVIFIYYCLLTVSEGVDVNRKRIDHIEAYLRGDAENAVPRQTKRKADR